METAVAASGISVVVVVVVGGGVVVVVVVVDVVVVVAGVSFVTLFLLTWNFYFFF